jgi:hypothetical protein
MLLDALPAFKQFFLQNLDLFAEVNRPPNTSEEEHARYVCILVEAAWRRHLSGKRSGTGVDHSPTKKVKVVKQS